MDLRSCWGPCPRYLVGLVLLNHEHEKNVPLSFKAEKSKSQTFQNVRIEMTIHFHALFHLAINWHSIKLHL